MMRKIIVLLLVGLLAVVLPASATLAQGEEAVVVCSPFQELPCEAESGDEVVIVWGWLACSKGLVKNFLKAIDGHEYTVTGPGDFDWSLGTEAAQDLWGPIAEVPAPEGCMGKAPSGAVSAWVYETVGPLVDTGEYTLRMTLSVKHPVVDGGDWDGDGRPDVFTGIDQTKTITVTPPNG